MRISPLLLLIVLLSTTGKAQTANEMDDKIDGFLKMLDDGSMDRNILNDSISIYLLSMGAQIPEVIIAPFPKATKNGGLVITTSDDSTLRVYTWDTHEKTAANTVVPASVFQWRSGNKVMARGRSAGADEDPFELLGECLRVEVVRAAAGKTVYLVTDHFAQSPANWTETVRAFTISNDSLVTWPLFKTDGVPGYKVSLSYNPSISSDINMHMSRDRKFLMVPLVEGGKVDKKYMAYTFDGSCFVFDRNAK